MKVRIEIIAAATSFSIAYKVNGNTSSRDLPAKGRWPIPTGAQSTFVDLTEDTQRLDEAYIDFIDRQGGKTNAAFADYLGAVLFSPKQQEELVSNDGLQLELILPHEEVLLAALPWELARLASGRFLAAIPKFSFVRVLAATNARPYETRSPPVTLFVLGAHVLDSKIRPATEYLCILRAVAGLRSHLLMNATPARMKKAIELLKPCVVHFLGHGERTPPRVELRGNDGNESEWLSPALLAETMTVAGRLPPVVVLNACHTAAVGVAPAAAANAPTTGATPADGRFTSSFARELVKLGVGTVVAIGGEVSDQAGRLFARRMYEALADGSDWLSATSHARRFALLQVAEPASAIDWALPTVFFAEQGRASTLPPIPEDVVVWRQKVENLVAAVSYPPFCDRWSLWESFERMLSAQKFQAIGGGEVRALLIESANKHRAGKSIACREFNAHALRNGHLPLLVDANRLTKEAPDRVAALWQAIARRLNVVGAELDITVPAPDLFTPDSVKKWLGEALAAVRQRYPNVGSERYCVIFIDNAHELSADLQALLMDYWMPNALLAPNSNIRVVLTYAHLEGREVLKDALTDWRSQFNMSAGFALSQTIDEKESDLVYDQFLLRWSREHNGGRVWAPLVAVNADSRQRVKQALHRLVDRVLPNFCDRAERLNDVVATSIDLRAIREANDEDVLLSYRGEG